MKIKKYTGKQVLLATLSGYMDEAELNNCLKRLDMCYEDIEKIKMSQMKTKKITFWEGVAK